MAARIALFAATASACIFVAQSAEGQANNPTPPNCNAESEGPSSSVHTRCPTAGGGRSLGERAEVEAHPTIRKRESRGRSRI